MNMQTETAHKETEILELKSTIAEIKNSLEQFNNCFEMAGERISEPENRNYPILVTEKEDWRKMNRASEICATTSSIRTHTQWKSQKERREEVTKFDKNINPHIQEA